MSNLHTLTEKIKSKLWRMNNLYYIRDKLGALICMKLNSSQRKVLVQYRHNKKIILKSRQQGISTLYLAYNLDSCIFKSGIAVGIQSYGQDEAEKLSKRAQLMWDEFPQELKDLLGIKIVTNNSKGMSFSNGSILKIGNFRGDTLQALHVSELAKIANKYPEKAKELKTGAFQAVSTHNKITIESTAEGSSGLFYEMWRHAEARIIATKGELTPLDFQPIFLSWMEDPDCVLEQYYPESEYLKEYIELLIKNNINPKQLMQNQMNWLNAKLDELGGDFNQEYPATPNIAFSQSLEGTYYKHQFKRLKYITNSYDANLKVHSSFDLGVDDTFAIGFFQKHPDGKIKIIGEYMASGFGLEHYRDIFASLTIKYGWVHGNTYVPHDISVRELIAAKTRWDALIELGFKPILVKKHKLVDGIEATRQFLKTVEIDLTCINIIKSIQTYRKKYDKKYNVYLDSPVHDSASHPADMLRYLAMGDSKNPITDIYVNKPINIQKVQQGFDI